MRKTLLSLAALALSLSMNAQTVRPFSGQVEKSNVATQQRVITLSPKKADLASNQRLVGYYTTDELAKYGIGIPGYGKNCKAAIDLTPEMLQAYDGMKVVAIRFGLCYKMNKSRVFISPINNKVIGEDVVSKDVASPVKGWNTITLDEPYTISQDQEIFVGFDFIQNSTPKGNSYTEDCFPISVVQAGRTDMPVLMFANIPASAGGSGEGWYSFGTENGNLSIQLIVEGDFADYSVTPEDFGKISAAVNKESRLTLSFNNLSKEAVNDLDYIMTIDGVAEAEQHVKLSEAVATGNTGSLSLTIPAQAEAGKKALKIEITKVNGNVNEAKDKVAEGELGISATQYPRNAVVEEFTTEKCPKCPAGAKVLTSALAKVDETRTFTACHHAGFYTDWLTKSWDEDLVELMFGNQGSFAPGIMFNRTSDDLPKGQNLLGNVLSLNAYSASVIAAFINNELNGLADAALTVDVALSEDGNTANVTVNGECNEGYDTESSLLTLYLTEDNIKAKSQSGASGKFYHNHVIRYANSSWGEQVEWDNKKFTKTFSIPLTSTWAKDKMKVVAFLSKHNKKNYKDCKIANSNGRDLEMSSGINGVINGKQLTEVARYTIDGVKLTAPQQGLNIVKMSDGSTIKVMVK
ncbi:Omp28-related outer membrane protein [Prevotella sp.]|uniref:Omp28-related outer membrane protein n=1 Tax=Prevotella sp. TaxID=59823 RepID=UPI00307FA322